MQTSAKNVYDLTVGFLILRGAGSGGQGTIAALPFNILKTRGHKGQIVPFEICLTEIFLDLLYI